MNVPPARVLLLVPTSTYKVADFLEAAERLGIAVTVGSERQQALEELASGGGTVTLDLDDPARLAAQVAAAHARTPFAGVVGADDDTVVAAALAAQALGLSGNSPEAAAASRDKLESRERFGRAGLRTPRHRTFAIDGSPEAAAGEVGYPCVLKPLFLSGSRGVLRANDPGEFAASFRRIRALLLRPGVARKGGAAARRILVEEFVPGPEIALEGLLERGALRTLAVFDKPDPLDGPTFAETLYVTPSRHLPNVLRAAEREVAAGCRALGLAEGPVHAELRLRGGTEPWLLEIAARTIGGLCARSLRFGAGIGLEELVLRHAVGLEVGSPHREAPAAGVLMLPVPSAGRVVRLAGVRAAKQVAGIVDVVYTVHRGASVEPLPEGDRYLGFVFARGGDPGVVEAALREAWGRLEIGIEAPGS